MLGKTQLGLNFVEDSTFWGAEYEVKDAVEHEVDRVVEQQNAKWRPHNRYIVRYMDLAVGKNPSLFVKEYNIE